VSIDFNLKHIPVHVYHVNIQQVGTVSYYSFNMIVHSTFGYLVV